MQKTLQTAFKVMALDRNYLCQPNLLLFLFRGQSFICQEQNAPKQRFSLSQAAVSLSMSRQFTIVYFLSKSFKFRGESGFVPVYEDDRSKIDLYLYIQTWVSLRAAGTLRSTCSVTWTLSLTDPSPPKHTWFKDSTPNAYSTPANHVWGTSRMGKAWPGPCGKEAEAPGL